MVAAADGTREGLSLDTALVLEQQQTGNSNGADNSAANSNANAVANLSNGTAGVSLKRYQCWKKQQCCSGNALFLGSVLLLCTLMAITFLVYYWTINCETEHELKRNNQSFGNRMELPVNGKSSTGSFVGGGENPMDSDVRLPRSLKPLHYNLTIQPYLQEGNFSFDGRVQIHLKALEDCTNITLHAFELNITEGDIEVRRWSNSSSPSHSTLQIGKHYFIESKHFLIIDLLEHLLANEEYLVDIRFHGLMQNYMQGFYHSSYRNHLNETR